MNRTTKGSVTIYLMLVFEILMVLIVTSITEARKRAMHLRAQTCLDMGLYSIFGEYNRDLLQRYDIFAIDTTYGGECADYRYTESHLLEYLQYNMEPSTGYLAYGSKDLLRLHADVVHFTGLELMTDQSGDPLVRQIVEYMEHYYGFGMLEGVMDILNEASDNGLVRSGNVDYWKESKSQIDQAKQNAEDDNWVSTFVNPADEIYSDRSAGILRLVVSDINSLSQKVVDTNALSSHRPLAKGTKLSFMTLLNEKYPRERDIYLEHLMVDEYCIRKMSHYGYIREEEPLSYQLEYILNGKNSDLENLKDTCNQLLGIREISNMLHIRGDSKKNALLDKMAGTITIQAPYLKIPVKYTLMAAWAFAESLLDIRLLLNGWRVPLIKENSDWNLTLESLLDYKDKLSKLEQDNEEEEEEDETRGLYYVDYLRILLATKSLNRITYRISDIMELYMRNCKGNTYFRMDACINSAQASLFVSSDYGQQFDLIRMYSYCY